MKLFGTKIRTRKRLKLLLIFAMISTVTAFSVFPVLSAENYIVLQGFAFDINADGEAVLHGYDDRSPDVVIPKKLMGADVTAIDDYAFFGDEAITALSFNSALSLKKSAQTPFTAAIAL